MSTIDPIAPGIVVDDASTPIDVISVGGASPIIGVPPTDPDNPDNPPISVTVPPQDIVIPQVSRFVCVERPTVLAQVQRRLADANQRLWTAAELNEYIQDAYNDMTLRTGCLWATDISPDVPAAMARTQIFEKKYMLGGYDAMGAFNFTAEWERDYINNATGPANHNHTWEWEDGHVTELTLPTEVSALYDLPDNLYEIERTTWDSRRIDPRRSREFEQNDSRYELAKGNVDAYTQDKDGLRRLRKWRVPSAPFVPYEFDESSSEYGIIVDISDVDSDTPLGSWGDFVQVDGQHSSGDPWGVIVGVYDETNAVKIEYRKRGVDLDHDCLEIPERYVVYLRWYVMARALEREGDAQDLDLAAHYQTRYEAGIARMLKRQQAMVYQKKMVMGGSRGRSSRLPLAQLPWAYGKVVR